MKRGKLRKEMRKPNGLTSAENGIELARGGKLYNASGSNFYDPAYSIAKQLSDAMDPDTPGSKEGKVLKENVSVREYNPETKAMTFSYRLVKRRTEKGLLVGMEGKNVWLPKSKVKFIEGNLIEIPYYIALRKGLTRSSKPDDFS